MPTLPLVTTIAALFVAPVGAATRRPKAFVVPEEAANVATLIAIASVVLAAPAVIAPSTSKKVSSVCVPELASVIVPPILCSLALPPTPPVMVVLRINPLSPAQVPPQLIEYYYYWIALPRY